MVKMRIQIVSLILLCFFFFLSGKAQNLKYSVEWAGNRVVFNSVSGLDQSVQQQVSRKNALSVSGSALKQTASMLSISLKGGICRTDNELYKWFGTFIRATKEKRDITVKLLNSNNEVVKTWKIYQASPVKVEGPTLTAKGNEVAIETVVLTCEGIDPE
jgi:phage tail-like protein